ncbi:MAG: hypothetical protein ACOCSR_04295, partial [Wenzhouxiangella sp.]
EYARYFDLEPGQFPFYYSNRGHFNARLGNDEQAVADLERARQLMRRQQDDFDRRLAVTIDMLLAWVRCRNGANGQSLLDELGSEQSLLARPREQTQLREARATCLWQAGETEPALDEIEALVEAEPRPSGLVDAADRRIVQARMLADLDRPEQAATALEQAESWFIEHGLTDHPLLERLRDQRRSLR